MDLGIPAMIAAGFKTQAEIEQTSAQLKMFDKTSQGQAIKQKNKDRRIKRKVKYKRIVDDQRQVIEGLESSLAAATDDAVKDSLKKRIRFEIKYLEDLQDLI
jgi:N-glycosylase/DNA lyase